uniref:NH(3)-dependent NAD(+) synthetase n=1 Tax=candidate division WOR-3 bacterium TaxID=2052148 RepID=A0A7C4YGS5_UNCW3
MKIGLFQSECTGKIKDKIEIIKDKIEKCKSEKTDLLIISPFIIENYHNKFFDNILENEKNKFLKEIARLSDGIIIGISFSEEIYLISKDKILKGKNYINYELNGSRFSFFTSLSEKIEKNDVLVNLDISPYHWKKLEEDYKNASELSKNSKSNFIHISPFGFYEGKIYEGKSFILNKEGECLKLMKDFDEDFFITDLKGNGIKPVFSEKYESIFNALKCGIKYFFSHSIFNNAIVGLSGGIDSSLVLTLAVHSLGKDNVFPIFLPSVFTSTQSRKDAFIVSERLGLKLKEIPIDRIFNTSRETLIPLFGQKPFDITEENMQARIRGYLLMAYANKMKGIVLATGNKSEIAMGYCTLYGDTVGGIAPIGDLLKKDVYGLAKWINDNISEIFNESLLLKPPSAELRREQKDEDDIPPYKILDSVLEMIFEGFTYDEILKKGIKKEILEDIIKRIRLSEFKRRQLPISLKVYRNNFCNIKIPFESEV